MTRVILCSFLYLTSVFVLRRMLDGVAKLLAKIGSPELWMVLRQHPFSSGVLIGLVSGLIPLDFWLSVSGFFRADILEFLKKLDLEEMKKWVFVIFSPFMIMTVLDWVIDWHAMHSRQLTVLSNSSSMPISTMFDGFFSTNCRNVSDVRLDIWTNNFDYQCSVHILWVSSLLTAAGYSLAPWIRAHLQPTQMIDLDEPVAESSDAIDPESKMAESVEEK